jgi:uncharacterized protein
VLLRECTILRPLCAECQVWPIKQLAGPATIGSRTSPNYCEFDSILQEESLCYVLVSAVALTMKIGLVSDTHGYFDPILQDLLAGVDSILHAGDVGSRAVLDDLERIAAVRAVQGNVDSNELNLPPSLKVRLENVQIEVQHQLLVPQDELEKWKDGSELEKSNPGRRARFLQCFDPETMVVVFGHSHRPCLLMMGRKLFFNPGSCGKKRFSLPRCFGFLEIFPRGVRGSIIGLEGEDGNLPGNVWLPLGE